MNATRPPKLLLAICLVFPALFSTGCVKRQPETPSTVRVAALQCYTRMGRIEYNRDLLTRLIVGAAEQGAQIVVMPEAAVCGYMDPASEITWAAQPSEDNEMTVASVAETIPGPSTRYFGKLAAQYDIYLAIALIEKADDSYYNAQVLCAPDGKIVAHHRKRNLWPPGDGAWASPGDRPLQIVDTPFGRLGMMICFDTHTLAEELGKHQVDIVLYSVGWYGPEPEAWFLSTFPDRYVIPNGFSLIAANWSADESSPGWPGHGYSCIISADGRILACAATMRGNEVVIANLPVGHRIGARTENNSSSKENH